MTMTITINERNYFVKNTRELTNGLFTAGTTANGTFKILKNRIHFFNIQGNLFAALIKSKAGDCFFVNATKEDCLGGRVFYQYATGDKQEQMLGLSGMGYTKQRNVAERIAKEVF